MSSQPKGCRNIKTRFCRGVVGGKCQEGYKCNFAHSIDEITPRTCRNNNCNFTCNYIHNGETLDKYALRMNFSGSTNRSCFIRKNMGPLDEDFLLNMINSVTVDDFDNMFYSSSRERTRSIRRSVNDANNLWEDLGYMAYKRYIPYKIKFASQTTYERKNKPCPMLTIDQKFELEEVIWNEYISRKLQLL